MDGKRSRRKAFCRSDAGYDGELGRFNRVRNNPSKRAQYSFVASEFSQRPTVSHTSDCPLKWRCSSKPKAKR